MKKLLVVGLVILAILSAVVAAVYFTKTAGNLPHFYPGYLQGSPHKHTKHGVAFAGLAIVFLVGAWMASGQSKDSPASKHTEEDK
ncbi:MAG TPA: hypothetical protein VNG32_05215 [Candidatus Dormibacteraeota bacterium]|nr:hypothetical protein [Candidatus Dormibacteraeota bacterium]